MEEHGVLVDIEKMDLRQFIYLSDRAQKEKNDRIQRQKAAAGNQKQTGRRRKGR